MCKKGLILLMAIAYYLKVEVKNKRLNVDWYKEHIHSYEHTVLHYNSPFNVTVVSKIKFDFMPTLNSTHIRQST